MAALFHLLLSSLFTTITLSFIDITLSPHPYHPSTPAAFTTPSPTGALFPCDYIAPVTNASNCGACVANASCVWCSADHSCHLSAAYDSRTQCVNSKTGDAAEAISGAHHLMRCCAVSTSCAECTTLDYVLCDWCIPSRTCFNSSLNAACEGGRADNGKEIVFKDGVCHGDAHETWWDRLRDYYFEVPLLFRCILLTLTGLCLVLLCCCVILWARTKLRKRRMRKKKRKLERVKINASRDYFAYTEKK